MKADEKLESYEITDYHRLKYLGDDLNEVLTLLLKGMRAGVGLFEVSKTIRALYLNEAYFECIGYTQEEYAEKEENVLETLIPEDAEGFLNCIMEHAPKREPINYNFRGYLHDGTLGYFEVRATAIVSKLSDYPIYLTVIFNVTDAKENEIHLEELKKVNAELSIQQERYKILEATAHGLLFEYSPATDTMVFSYNFPDNKKRKVIPNYTNFMRRFPLVHSKHIAKFEEALSGACKEVTEGTLEYLSTVSGGGYRWHSTHYKSLADESGKVISVIGRIEDIHDQKMEKEHLNYKADVDGLTKLYRKEAAFIKMQEYVNDAPEGEFYFVILDLDDFKQINDRHGHQYGDEVLKQMAAALVRIFGENSILGRFGGDEFVILTKNVTKQEVIESLKQIQSDVKFCAGVVPWKNQEDVKDIFDWADHAMYQMKYEQKNGIKFMDRM